jgi:hypothetical protein
LFKSERTVDKNERSTSAGRFQQRFLAATQVRGEEYRRMNVWAEYAVPWPAPTIPWSPFEFLLALS